ncbi:MAG: TetR/AcrR family transcriptional regulator [Paracoccaceae bacterium]
MPAGRGRPRKFDADEGVATALKLFAEHGYDAVGVSEICTRIGITPTSLYAAYDSKFNLFKAAIDVYTARAGQFVPRALEAAGSPDELWARILFAAAKQYSSGTEKGCPVLDGLLRSRDAEVIRLTSAQVQATQDAISARLSELGDGDADRSAAAILVVMRGLSTSARAGVSGAELSSVVEVLLQQRKSGASLR